MLWQILFGVLYRLFSGKTWSILASAEPPVHGLNFAFPDFQCTYYITSFAPLPRGGALAPSAPSAPTTHPTTHPLQRTHTARLLPFHHPLPPSESVTIAGKFPLWSNYAAITQYGTDGIYLDSINKFHPSVGENGAFSILFCGEDTSFCVVYRIYRPLGMRFVYV